MRLPLRRGGARRDGASVPLGKAERRGSIQRLNVRSHRNFSLAPKQRRWARFVKENERRSTKAGFSLASGLKLRWNNAYYLSESPK